MNLKPSHRRGLHFTPRRRTGRISVAALEYIRQVSPRPLAQNIRMVRGRADTDSFGRAAIRVAERVGELLDLIGDRGRVPLGGGRARAEDLVEHDDVVRGPAGALQHGVRLQIELPQAFLGHAAVDDGARLQVGRALVVGGVGVHVAGFGGVEAGMMAFADNDDGEAGQGFLGLRKGGGNRLAKL